MINFTRAFKDLISEYDTLTLDKVREAIKNTEAHGITISEMKESLTGFGNKHACNLCDAIDLTFDSARSCAGCVWFEYAVKYLVRPGIIPACVSASEGTANTYNAIKEATNVRDLVDAYADRAEHMKGVLKALGYVDAD